MTSETGREAMEKAIADDADPRSSAGSNSSQKWTAALATLVSARLEIIALESREAVGIGVMKAAWAAIAVICGIVFWFVLLAGLIGFVPQVSGLDWFHVAFIVAGLHLLVAFIALMLLKKKTAPVFGVTKSELIKDKQWLSSAKQEPTSKS